MFAAKDYIEAAKEYASGADQLINGPFPDYSKMENWPPDLQAEIFERVNRVQRFMANYLFPNLEPEKLALVRDLAYSRNRLKIADPALVDILREEFEEALAKVDIAEFDELIPVQLEILKTRFMTIPKTDDPNEPH
jgi:hypothetical protein